MNCFECNVEDVLAMLEVEVVVEVRQTIISFDHLALSHFPVGQMRLRVAPVRQLVR